MFQGFLRLHADVARLKGVDDVTRRIGRGVFKRIDENRELIELMQARCPQILDAHPWVECWIRSHDDFFTELAKASQAVNPQESRNRANRHSFPRHWPAKRPLESK